jgi:hypothetical protein
MFSCIFLLLCSAALCCAALAAGMQGKGLGSRGLAGFSYRTPLKLCLLCQWPVHHQHGCQLSALLCAQQLIVAFCYRCESEQTPYRG